MSVGSASALLEDPHEQLETVPTLVEFVQEVPVDGVLDDTTITQFEARTYDAGPIVRALVCRELAGLSWNGLYEFCRPTTEPLVLASLPGSSAPTTQHQLGKRWRLHGIAAFQTRRNEPFSR